MLKFNGAKKRQRLFYCWEIFEAKKFKNLSFSRNLVLNSYCEPPKQDKIGTVGVKRSWKAEWDKLTILYLLTLRAKPIAVFTDFATTF